MSWKTTFAALALAALALTSGPAYASSGWDEIVSKARGQAVYWNAWGGDERTNSFIDWVGKEAQARYGITVRQVKLSDTAEAVSRVIAEKTAGRDTGGSVDLIWINGPNFLSLKEKKLLYGPFTQLLPNYRDVDVTDKQSNVTDFTTPVEGMASPWRLAQFIFNYDSSRVKDVPRTIPEFLPWAKAHPGRFTHPDVRDFMGATFLKQALIELAPDRNRLQQPAADEDFASETAPLWAWYDQLRPLLWRHGEQFPANGPAERQLLGDGEIDLSMTFDPAEAAASIKSGLLPDTVRTYTLSGGTIGNTSFVAIPYNSPHKEAAMVVADFLLDPATQAHAQDIRALGSFTVLDLEKLSAEQRKLFNDLPKSPALPTNKELGPVLLEPHPSWMTRITDEWMRRYGR
ncbi:ABC transporter substrate-binding protein [Mesorhizobium sp.]|uniref:ABC transporter substrate-binding protein n=1 Tax=Mesorhizobium sp. TaxID=1871066 RepID=UPI000FE6D36D|nr:ABC transporter substrate-binding protein [Mesorhizobium sp.]RWM19440.1 MAG: ABC transporter substrate-binding protein [Mesorhizobium sp.]RWM31229.1 MAG: ABC transporter substrate-binding protein [Mesorhizobium sp.]TIO72986.1 MAG: ABC transporter substrate-binding protein [Mesorhizobium sp.]TIO80968.1 MAG: ABC transporter substrate-binding protein [Mesorhizobium sp.]TJV47977.1 MAG: ABC transporter substrate-binding protein [Mesorhizobium sp.]